MLFQCMFKRLSEQVVAIYKEMKDLFGLEIRKKMQELPYQFGQILTQESQDFNKTQTILQALLLLNNSSAIACEAQFLK